MESGWHGLPEYVAVVVVASLSMHLVWRHYVGASLVITIGSSILNFADNVRRAEVIDPTVLMFGPMELVAGVIVALPIAFAIGFPFELYRRGKQAHTRTPPSDTGASENRVRSPGE